MARSHQEEDYYYHLLWGQLSTTCSDATEVAQWAAPSCSQPQQLRTMPSEKVDLIDWPLPPTLYRAVPHKRHWQGANERYILLFIHNLPLALHKRIAGRVMTCTSMYICIESQPNEVS